MAEADTVQLSLFDERDLAEVTSPDFPGERLMVCRNPLLAAERARKREDLLRASEADLGRIASAVKRKTKPLRGADQIGLAVGQVLNRQRCPASIFTRKFPCTNTQVMAVMEKSARLEVGAQPVLLPPRKANFGRHAALGLRVILYLP
jgi:hypothetical protein